MLRVPRHRGWSVQDLQRRLAELELMRGALLGVLRHRQEASVKITDKYLRQEKDTWDSPFAGRIASELLQRRAEVRRLRRALVAVLWEHKEDCGCVGCAALAPKRKRRAK